MLRRSLPIRTRLTLATLLPLSVAMLICTIVGFSVLLSRIGSQTQEKVHSDLNAAREIYQHEIDHISDIARFTATAPYVAEALGKNDRNALSKVLVPLLGSERLDILAAVDTSGAVVFRAQNPRTYGDNVSADFLVRKALAGKDFGGTSVLPQSRLGMEGASLAASAVIKVLPTLHAKVSGKLVEDAGMFLTAASPVRDAGGRVIGALYGGVMLNNNNALVDKIRAVVYEGGKNAAGYDGTATVFLNDLRIATNVTGTDNRRAIGTRLSEEVYNRVVLMKERWLDRAFVVKDWYFSAYEPILSIEGAPVGALYVGMLEKPFTRLKFNMVLLVAAILMFGSLVGVFVARAVASRLASPIAELASLARRVAAGERHVAAKIESDDELGALAEEFNRMSDSLSARESEIRELNRDLEEKVRLRTGELEEKSAQLIQAQHDLAKVERLAAIGELAAGVAHEINNPLAIIKGNAELAQMSLPADAPVQEEIEIIARQVGRMERIVSKLLKFASREQKKVGRTDIAAMLDEILDQIGHHISLEGITVRRELPPAAEIVADSDQLRQVFTNLVLNAIQSMPGGGELTVSVRDDAAAGCCEIAIRDTGTGIEKDHLEKIFNPFFTTRRDGTGLGLAVSYGIVKDHDGTIAVDSQPGKGTCFRVMLPATAVDRAGG